MTPTPLLTVAEDSEILADDVALLIAARIAETRDRFGLCLSGGTTPRRIYERLAEGDPGRPIDWRKVHLFWGDERFVPADHEDSNFRMVRQALLDHVAIPAAQIHSVPTSFTTPQEAAAAYSQTLKAYYQREALDPARPLFDLTLLGLGEDGHTASLFPNSQALTERQAWAIAVIGAKPEPRITLTYPALESSREIVFIVAGAQKRAILARLLANEQALPAARLSSRGIIRIAADRAAAGH